MTTALNDVRQTPALHEFKPGTLRSAWPMLGALVVVAGLAYCAGRLTTPMRPAARPPSQAVAAPVVQNTIHEPEPIAEAASSSDRQPEHGVDEPAQTGASQAYYVQVASYKGAEDAAEYARSLSARGLPTLSSPDPSNAAWQLVQLGPFQSRGEAETARFKLKLHERETAYVQPRSNGKYHVQVGSFASREEAEPLAKRFAMQGHATKISRIKMGDRRWYCVRIGPFDTAEEATDYQVLLKAVSNTEGVVIPFGPPKS